MKFEPATDMIENNGLGIRILFVGKKAGENRVVISAELKNTATEASWLALIGPAPAAVDTMGTVYSLKQVNGIPACKSLAGTDIARCMTNSGGFLPGMSFSKIESGSSSLVSFVFEAGEVPPDGFLSFSTSVATARGDRPSEKADRNLENVAVSFPLIPLKGTQ